MAKYEHIQKPTSKGKFFVRLAYGVVGRYMDTKSMTTREVIEEFLDHNGVKTPKEFFEKKFIKNNPKPQIGKSKEEYDVGYVIGEKNLKIRKKTSDFKFTGDNKPHKATIYQLEDGMNFVWDNEGDEYSQNISPTQAIKVYQSLPEEIRALSQRTITFVNYSNPDDGYWRNKYSNFTESLASSGKEITFYANKGVDDDYLRDTYIHEIAHNIDLDLMGGHSRFSESAEYRKIMESDGASSPTLYAKEAPVEDFAESIMMYYSNRDIMEKYFPNRTKFIKSILGG